MQGLMQDWPLLVHTILDHARANHAEREVVSRTVEGPLHRYTYGDMYGRTKRLAKALSRLGVKRGQVVGTLAWNTHRHMETWYAVMGIGAVCHTLNPRLFVNQLTYIVDHAEDQYIVLDLNLVPIAEQFAPHATAVKGYIILTDRAHMPETTLPNVLCYEELIAAEDEAIEWTRVDERDAAGLCYTSGTTGNPKGVLYSHRSNVLHALSLNAPDVLGLRSTDAMLPIVPMFHANAWGAVFTAPLNGAKLVHPGPRLDGESLYQLFEAEGVTVTAAVPTVWLGLLHYLETSGNRLTSLKRTVVGGSALPRIVLDKFEENYGVEVIQGWGMTEMSPVGAVSELKAVHRDMPREQQITYKLKQGRAIFGVEMKLVDDDGAELPHDGKTFGHLVVRGPSITSRYYKLDNHVLDAQGYFDTGDIATIDEYGYMQITDRAKDVIKSGGEWISSIELENLAVGHPDIAEAAVIGAIHPKWDERPLLIVVRKPGHDVTKEALLSFFEGKIAKWWMPDDVVFVDELPHTATGKIQKRTLRERWAKHLISQP